MEIVVRKNGNAHCIYGEAIPVPTLGTIEIKRASHVEPDADGKWIADLNLINGPMLGPFEHRTEALNAEVAWLKDNWL